MIVFKTNPRKALRLFTFVILHIDAIPKVLVTGVKHYHFPMKITTWYALKA
jgi:hypothetical protein